MKVSQSPSLQSIYLNAMPYYLDRADIFTLDKKGDSFPVNWVSDLLNGNLSVQVNASGQSSDKLRHLYFESKNIERTKGPKILGFGYPFFIETFENDLIVAPLFIWHMNIEPSQNLVNSWVIRHDEKMLVVPNYKLIRHLEANHNVELKERFEELALNKKLSLPNLELFCQQLADTIGIDNKTYSGNIAPSPGIDEIGTLSERGTILWCGILGLFPSQKFKKLPLAPKPEDAFLSSPLPSGEKHYSFHFLPCDPYQASALSNADNHKISVIEGNPTSGKSHTLVNLLINALSNGEKCLVVSENVPTLKKAQELLSQAGIHQFNFLLKDALNDTPIVLEMIRVAAAGAGQYIEHSETDFDFKLQRYLREKRKLNANYLAAKNKVFGQFDWTETVGLFLSSNRIEGKELLSSQLNPNDFEFTHQEYEIFKQVILTSRPLYQKVNTLKHPLTNLNEEIFNKTREEGLNYLKKNLRRFLNKAGKLQHRYINKTDSYALKLREHYERHFERLSKRLTRLNEKIADYSRQFGSEFNQSGLGSLKFLGLFSPYKKKIAFAKQDISRDYLALVKLYESGQYFEFSFAPCKDGQQTPKVVENLDAFSIALNNWQKRIEDITQDELMRLNSRNVHPDLDYKEQISELEYALDILIEEINQSEIYQKPIQNKTLTIAQRQKYLESIIEHLETTQLNLRDFDYFHHWQKNWLGLGILSQKLIRALVKVKPTDWMAAFESWYFNNILTKNHLTDLPTGSEGIGDYTTAYYALKPLIINQINYIWQKKQLEELKKLRRRKKKAWQLIFDKNNLQYARGKMLDDILAEGFDAVTAFLPILFTTPYIARHILPENEGYFNYLIFDEGSRFSVENATPIALLGKRIVVFGGNESFGSETSLLQYVRENGAPANALLSKYSYREKEKTELRFGSEKTKSGLGFFPQEFHVDNVEGRFDEREGSNNVEAQQIIRLLNQVQQTQHRTYPSVGIICFTIQQRDLISSYLLKIKQKNVAGSDKIKQLERNGMGVFHVDELYGQHFDILFVSFTFGTINVKGKLSKKAWFFNTPEGISQIRLIINKVPKKIFLVHSIPDNYLNQYLKNQLDEGTFLLANFIQFGQASQKNNVELQKQILPVLTGLTGKEEPKSVFVREVANALRPYFESNRLLSNIPLEKIILPLSIKPIHENAPPVVVHPDGFFADTPLTSFLWEYKQQEMIRNLGLDYQPLWSVNWWKNPKQEARKLASIIIKKDSLFGPISSSQKTEKEKEDKEKKVDKKKES